MRTKLIITGAIGVLAAATLTVNAQTSQQTTTPGSVARLLAASTQIARTDRDDVAIASRVSTSATAAAASVKAEAAEKAEPTRPGAPRLTLPAGCQAAVNSLKALHLADVSEDATERSTAETAATIAADRAEDATEAQQWVAALKTVRSACVPQLPTACQTATAGLAPVLEAWRSDELAELQTRADMWNDDAAVRAAFSAVATACFRSE